MSALSSLGSGLGFGGGGADPSLSNRTGLPPNVLNFGGGGGAGPGVAPVSASSTSRPVSIRDLLTGGDASQAVIDPNNVIGARTQLPEGGAKRLGLMDRLRAVDPVSQESGLEKFSRIGGMMRDDGGGADAIKALDGQIAARKAQAKNADLQRQVAALFPDDPKMRFLMMANPEAATEALAKAYDPTTLSKGQQQIINGRTVAAAADYGQQDGYAYSVDPRTGQTTWGPQRGRTHGEELRQGELSETVRHNQAGERINDFEARTGRMNAGTGAFSAQTSRAAHEARLAAGGYGTPGGAGGYGMDLGLELPPGWTVRQPGQ